MMGVMWSEEIRFGEERRRVVGVGEAMVGYRDGSPCELAWELAFRLERSFSSSAPLPLLDA